MWKNEHSSNTQQITAGQSLVLLELVLLVHSCIRTKCHRWSTCICTQEFPFLWPFVFVFFCVCFFRLQFSREVKETKYKKREKEREKLFGVYFTKVLHEKSFVCCLTMDVYGRSTDDDNAKRTSVVTVCCWATMWQQCEQIKISDSAVPMFRTQRTHTAQHNPFCPNILRRCRSSFIHYYILATISIGIICVVKRSGNWQHVLRVLCSWQWMASTWSFTWIFVSRCQWHCVVVETRKMTTISSSSSSLDRKTCAVKFSNIYFCCDLYSIWFTVRVHTQPQSNIPIFVSESIRLKLIPDPSFWLS